MKSTLSVQNISKSYGKRSILRSINFKVNSGEVVGIFGPNGAGKTTLFSIIIGDQYPSKGTIKLNSHDLTNLPSYQRARLGLGYLPQESSIFKDMTVEQNIAAVLELYEPNQHKRVQELEYLLSKFDVAKLRGQKARYLSGGEKRRVEIARALAAKPKFLLLDEPLAAIDPITIQNIKLIIKELKFMGIGIIITDHNVKDTLDIVDEAVIIYNHKVLTSGKPSEIVEDPDVLKYYLGESWKNEK